MPKERLLDVFSLPGGKETFVKFKDYAFFVPLNATRSGSYCKR